MNALEYSIEEAEAWTAAVLPQMPANVIAFPTQPTPPEPPETASTVNVAPARGVNDWVTTAELRALLKSKLGLNARQVTAKCSHSSQYLDLTIRDASVDVAAVQDFAASLNTWSMDITDYCSGQSINVSTTAEVDAIHAAPFLDEAKAAVAKIMGDEHGSGTKLANGKFLWKQENGYNGYYVSRELNGPRGQYVSTYEVELGTQWALAALALQIARV